MRSKLTNSRVATILLAGSLVGACANSSSASDPDDGASTPGVDVVLPAALGGGSGTAHLAASTPPTTRHRYGIPLPIPKPSSDHTSHRALPQAPPASVDLSVYAPPAGDQGDTGSCQSWATGYSAMGWWANRMGLANAKFAPMYLYSQIV